jgi:molybdopterin synthase catalytic subunit
MTSASSIRVQQEDFDVGAELGAMRENRAIGALACFVGLVRDVNDDAQVRELTLEHYPGMTEKSLDEIVRQAQARWDVIDVRVIHRVGTLRPTDQIVFVAVASAHRGEAFAACEFLMDYLKTRAPFWKKESTPEGDRWVDARTSDDAAAQRWHEGKVP